MTLTVEAKVSCDCEDCKESGDGKLVYLGAATPSVFFDLFGGGGCPVQTYVPAAWGPFCDYEGFFCCQDCRDKTLKKRKDERAAEAKRRKDERTTAAKPATGGQIGCAVDPLHFSIYPPGTFDQPKAKDK